MRGKLFLGVLIITVLTASISWAQLKIGTNGNVSIGTETIYSDYKLHVLNNTGNQGNYAIYAHGQGGGYNYDLRTLASNGSINYGIYEQASRGSSRFGVYGSAPVSTNSYAGYFNGNVYVTGTITQGGSDIGIKEDIKDLDSVLSQLIKLKAKTFKYKKIKDINFAEGTQYGFIAQELEEVFPELVVEHQHIVNDENREEPEVVTYKVIEFSQLIPILVQVIKE